MSNLPKLPQTKSITLPGGEPMEFCLIPAGRFLIGSRGCSASEAPSHEVVVPEAFYLGKHPVTQAQFREWTKVAGIKHENYFAGKPEHPAENMDWYKAERYCEWLQKVAKKSDLPSGKWAFGLPDEARWEWACRGGTETEYHSGDGEGALAEVGWYGEGLEKGSTHPVGKKPGNAYGLHDMHGNLWEWCADVYDRNAYRKRADGWKTEAWTLKQAGEDAEYWDSDKQKEHPHRVLRGGSWNDTAGDCRSAFRYRFWPDVRNWNYGFRVCLVPGPAGQQGGEEEGTPETDVQGAPGAADWHTELKHSSKTARKVIAREREKQKRRAAKPKRRSAKTKPKTKADAKSRTVRQAKKSKKPVRRT